jgi:hypothetical protein
MKRLIKWFIIILILGAGAWYLHQNGYVNLIPASGTQSTLGAIPSNAAVIILIDRPDRVEDRFRRLDYATPLTGLKPVLNFRQRLGLVDSLLVSSGYQRPNEQLTASLHLVSAEEVDYLFLFQHPTGQQIEIPAALPKETHTFQEIEVTEVIFGERKVAFAIVDGLLAISTTAFLVEDAIKQMQTDPITEDPVLASLIDKPGNGGLALYMNMSSLPSLAPAFLDQAYHGLASELQDLCSWMRLDLNFSNDLIALNGFAATSDSMQSLALHGGMPPLESKMQHLIPKQTAVLVHTLNQSRKGAPGWVGAEWAYVQLQAFAGEEQADAVAIIALADTVGFTDSMAVISTDTAGRTPMIGQRNLYQLKEAVNLEDVLGSTFASFKSSWFVLFNDHMIACNSQHALRSVISQLDDARSLGQDQDYVLFAENLTTATNKYVYVNTAKASPVIRKMTGLSPEAFVQDWGGLASFGQIGIQFSTYKDLVMANGIIMNHVSSEEVSKDLWVTTFDTSIIFGPQLIRNHQVQGLEVLVQDADYNLYLLSRAGKIKWKRELEGPIMGDVAVADFYNNGKLQYFFNTPLQINLIDVNGKDVSYFPVRLKTPATSPAFLVDYEGDKNYRYFISTASDQLYGFDRSGKPLPNWNPKTGLGKVSKSVSHFMHEGRDYLVIVNDDGLVRFYNRRGEERMDAIQLPALSANPIGLVPAAGGVACAVTDSGGRVWTVDQLGNKQSTRFGNWSTTHQFKVADVDGDSLHEYIFLDHQVLYVYDHDSVMQFKHAFQESFSGTLSLDEGTDASGISVTDTSARQVWYFGSSGKVLAQFPVKGTLPARKGDLLGSGEQVVVTGSRSGKLTATRLD